MVETGAHGEAWSETGVEAEAADRVRDAGLEPGEIAGIRDVLLSERILAGELIRLAEQAVERGAVRERPVIVQAGVEAGATLDPVPARELIAAEEVRIVEHQALRVLVRQLPRHHLVRSHDHLRYRLEDMRRGTQRRHHRPFPFDADGRHAAECALIRGERGRSRTGRVETEGVAAKRSEGRDHLAHRPYELPLP